MCERQVYIAFSGKTDLWWLKFLKPGYRHCFALICDHGHWFYVDPMSHYMELRYCDVPEAFDARQWIEGQGCNFIVQPAMKFPQQPAPFEFLTCVAVLKRLLGIHKPFIFTPWQLYKYLKNL